MKRCRVENPLVATEANERLTARHRPWAKQGMVISARQEGQRGLLWIGRALTLAGDPKGPSVGEPRGASAFSEWGGWNDKAEFLQMYAEHAADEGRGEKIGSYYGVHQVAALIGTLENESIIEHDQKEALGDDACTLIGQPTNMIHSKRGWHARGGCFETGAGWPTRLKQISVFGHQFTRRQGRTLPLWCKEPPTTACMMAERDKLLEEHATAQHIVQWDWKNGIPHCVIPLICILQNGKPRLIGDARYPNSAFEAPTLDLPTLARIVREITPTTLVAKADLKSGYHQLKLSCSERGQMAFLWRGRMWTFAVLPLGARDAPATFQAFTEAAAEAIMQQWPALKVFVYLDDFIFIVNEGEAQHVDLGKVYEFMAVQFGMVLGRDKCSTDWAKEICILGVHVDVNAGRVTLTDEKSRFSAGTDPELAGR